MKKAIILIPKQTSLKEDELRDFVEFAKNNDMQIIGVAHYPFLSAINHPKAFVYTLSRQEEVNTYIVDDEILIDSNAYNDGVLFEELKKANIHVYHSKYETELKNIWSALDNMMKGLLKDAVAYAKEKMNEHNAMIITNDKNQKNVLTSDFNQAIIVLSLFPLVLQIQHKVLHLLISGLFVRPRR
mgnify:CR=1 FL=1